jgi:DNA-binding CsgD family transcriptional regulator
MVQNLGIKKVEMGKKLRRADAILHTVLAASEALRLKQLDREAIPRLQQVLGASASTFYRFNDQGVIYPIGGTYLNDMPAYVVEFRHRDPIWDQVVQADPRLTVFLPVQAMGMERFRQSAIYHEYYRHYDAEDLCMLRFTNPSFGTPGTTGVMLFRSKWEPPFSVRDVATAQRLLPAFAAAVRRSEHFKTIENETLGLEALISRTALQPVLALNERGQLLWISPLARGLLGPDFDPKKHVPERLVFAARALAKASLEEKAPKIPQAALAFPLDDGRTLRANLFLWRSPTGEPAVAVFLEDGLKDPEAAFSIDPSFGLTPAETKVLEQLVSGLSNREMARRLFVSIETVRTHVSHILAKLEVRSRAEAVAHVLKRLSR